MYACVRVLVCLNVCVCPAGKDDADVSLWLFHLNEAIQDIPYERRGTVSFFDVTDTKTADMVTAVAPALNASTIKAMQKFDGQNKFRMAVCTKLARDFSEEAQTHLRVCLSVVDACSACVCMDCVSVHMAVCPRM